MSIYDDDWGEVTTPHRVSLEEQEQTGLARRNNTYVPAVAPNQPVRARRIDLPAMPVVDIPYTGSAQSNVTEHTTPVQRAYASFIGSAWFTLIALIVALLIWWMLDYDPVAAALLAVAVVLTSAYTYLKFNKREHDHSPAGLARHDRERTHDERMYALQRQFDAADRMLDHLIGDNHAGDTQ